MSGAQLGSGTRESVCRAASHSVWSFTSGTTVSEAATLASSIGFENSIRKAEPRPRPVTMFGCADGGLGPYVGAALAETPLDGSPTRSPPAINAMANPSAKTLTRTEQRAKVVT